MFFLQIDNMFLEKNYIIRLKAAIQWRKLSLNCMVSKKEIVRKTK